MDNKILNNLYNLKKFLYLTPKMKELKQAIINEDMEQVNSILNTIEKEVR